MPRLPPSDPALHDGARSLEPLRGAFREATGGRWQLSGVLRRGDAVLLSLVDPEVGELVLEMGWKTYARSSYCSSGGVGVSYRGQLDASQRRRLDDVWPKVASEARALLESASQPGFPSSAGAPDADDALEALRAEFGVRLADLPLELDVDAQHAEWDRVRELGSRPRVLLLTSPNKKYHEQAVLEFFDALPCERLDCIVLPPSERSTRPSLRRGRYLASLKEATPGDYHYIIALEGASTLLMAAQTVGATPVYLGSGHHDLLDDPRGRRRRVRQAMACAQLVSVYGTFRHTYSESDYMCVLGTRVDLRLSVCLPPNTERHYRLPERPVFPYLVLGGGDRDYRPLLQCADVFDGARVVVTTAQRGRDESARRNTLGLDALERDPRFLCVSWLKEDLYAKLLLHSRVVLVPARGTVPGDYTSIADAAWHGKPTLTPRCPRTQHLQGRVRFFGDSTELGRELRALRDPARYAAVAAETLATARANHDLYELLFACARQL